MSAPTTPRTRVAIGAVVVVAVLTAALLVTRGSSTSDAATVVAQPTCAALPGGAGSVEQTGFPGGYSRDGDGATAAAVVYATAPQRWLYFTDEQITDAVIAIATPEAAPHLVEDVVADVRTARDRLDDSSGRVWWLVRPLAWRVIAQNPEHATVAVWIVTILSAEKVAAPQTEFATVTVDLAWVDGGWRVDDVRDVPGPTPLTGPGDQPWDAGPFDRALAGFTRMDGEAVR